uniref:SSD domain-containing protein n=1 Tax=Globodera rostochiensis TaxID=31243 RepID=A0A914HXF1_GLORO
MAASDPPNLSKFRLPSLPPAASFAFDDHFMRAFWHWGLVVHRLRWPLFVVPFLLSAFLAFGFRWLEEQETRDPLFVFSPENAQWRFERAVLSEHWPLDEQHFWPGKSYDYFGYVDVIATGRRSSEYGGARPNILFSEYLNELERINQFIVHNLTVPVLLPNSSTREVGFTDLCMTYAWKCYVNDHITMLQPKGRWIGGLQAEVVELAKQIIEQEVHITYPIGWRGTEPIFFGALVGGVHLTDEEGHFDYASAVRLTFNVRGGPVGAISGRWRRRLAEFLSSKSEPASAFLEFGLYHNESLPEGLQDVANTLTPKIGRLLAFAVSVLSRKQHLNSDPAASDTKVIGIDWARSKPVLGVAALLCPVLATLSAFGLLLWLGFLYNAIVNVSPFIVLCVGIDDAFLMTAAWHRTNPELKTGRRLAETLSEAAVAITITSFTDMLSFGIGCFTTLPGVRLFCLYTFFGIFFTYLYQITYFAAVMAFAGEMEESGRHSLLCGIKTLRPGEADSPFKRWALSGSMPRGPKGTSRGEEAGGSMPGGTSRGEEAEGSMPGGTSRGEEAEGSMPGGTSRGEEAEVRTDRGNFSKWPKNAEACEDLGLRSRDGRQTFVNRFFRDVYGPFLLTRRTKLYALLCYSLFVLFSVLGVLHISEGLNPKNLVRSSFYLTDFYELVDETFWKEGLQLQVAVNNPPNLFDRTERKRLDEMVAAFEGTQFTMKHNATMLWLNEFEAQMEEERTTQNISLPQTSDDWYGRCREWLLVAGGRRLWELDMEWEAPSADGATPRLKAFRFQIGLRNYRTPADHTNGCRLMRSIASQFPEFNVTTFHEYYPFADQYLELKPALYRNCLLAMVCMMLVSFLMIPNWHAAFVITAAIASIDIGVLGYMSLWGVNLESVSMITIIMSIGFVLRAFADMVISNLEMMTMSGEKKEGGQLDILELSRDERAIAALETLGWPVFLGAFSTIVGIMVLTLVDAHIILIFFKTMFLVVTFSLLHGIVFLPILLTVAMPDERRPPARLFWRRRGAAQGHFGKAAAMVALDQFVVFCKVYASDGVHFVKVEAEKFTFNWLRDSFLKNKKVERVLAYDDLSGDRVLLSNEDAFKLMLDTMNDIGANMVKLHVEKKNKVTLADKCANCRGFVRGGSFGVFNAKNLAGCERIGTTSNSVVCADEFGNLSPKTSEKTFSKTLVNAYKAFLMLEKCTSFNVSGINVKLDGGSLKVVCVGKMGHSDVHLPTAERILTQLDSEPWKCAWVATEGCDVYVLEFEGEEDAREFCVAVKEMMDRSLQSEGRLRVGNKL